MKFLTMTMPAVFNNEKELVKTFKFNAIIKGFLLIAPHEYFGNLLLYGRMKLVFKLVNPKGCYTQVFNFET